MYFDFDFVVVLLCCFDCRLFVVCYLVVWLVTLVCCFMVYLTDVVSLGGCGYLFWFACCFDLSLVVWWFLFDFGFGLVVLFVFILLVWWVVACYKF